MIVISQEPQANSAPRQRGEPPSSPAGHWLSVFHFFRRRRGAGEKPYRDMEIFRTRVEHALALLAYGITEGRRNKEGEPQLTPEVIEQIIKAEDLLHLQEQPSWQQRADFEKAYLLLTRSLTPVSASVLEIPRWQQAKWFWSSMAGTYLFFTIFWFCLFRFQLHMSFRLLDSDSSSGQSGTEGATSVLVIALLSTAILAFIWRFPYWLTGVVTRQKLNQIITFCYALTFLAVLSPLVMIIIVIILPGELFRIMALESPIGISLACSLPLPDEDRKAIPLDIRCGTKDQPPHYEWLLNIGGAAGQQSWDWEGKDVKQLWQRPPVQIHGGLVVPLYVIMLAFIGGAVSMTRRVPEYQRRAADPYDSMTPEQAREYLVFQIMQLVSAPLVAITIYHIFAPTSRATAIVLGFISGFASEPLLLGLRALAEKLPFSSHASGAPEYPGMHASSVNVAKDGAIKITDVKT